MSKYQIILTSIQNKSLFMIAPHKMNMLLICFTTVGERKFKHSSTLGQ